MAEAGNLASVPSCGAIVLSAPVARKAAVEAAPAANANAIIRRGFEKAGICSLYATSE
jgi:hypothetical protein